MSQNNTNPVPPSLSAFSIVSEVPGNTLEDEVEELQESFVFPLFSEMAHVVVMPAIFCFIQFIIQILQSLMANMYVGNHHIWKSISSTPKVIRSLSYIINFGIIDKMNENNIGYSDDEITNDDFFNCWPIYISIVIYIIIEVIFFLIILYNYTKKRSFMKWSLYVAYVFLNTLNQLVFVPSCALAGYAIWQIDCHLSTSSIVYLLISLIPTLFLLFLITFNSVFSCNSIYLSRSIDSCWEAKIGIVFTFTIGFSAFLGPALNPFASWVVFVGLILSLFMTGYQLYLLYYLPYIKDIMNVVMQASCILTLVNIILVFVQYNSDINEIVHIVVPIAFFVVFCVLYFFLDKFRIKKALLKLDVQKENCTEKEKKEFLELINFGSNSMIVFYVRIGIAYMAPLCVDFSLMKFISSIRNSPDINFPLIQITTMFPSQTQFLSMLMAQVNKKGAHFSVSQNYLIYQARKVTILRQSVSTKREKKEADALFKKSEESISLIRGFWGETTYMKSNISTASLRYLRNATNKTSNAYLDSLEQYPRSQKIIDQYIRFLIEAKGDFEKSIHYMKKMIMIDRGGHMINDSSYKCFVNVFPKYLTEHILDYHGFYINKHDELQLNAMTNNTSNFSTSDLHDDEIASKLFLHSKLRLSLQGIINKSSLKSLNLLRVFSIISLLLISLLMIVLFIVISNTSDDLYGYVKSISITSKILTSIQQAQLITGAVYIEKSEVYSYDYTGNVEPGYLFEYLCKVLNIKNTSISEELSIYNKPYVKMNQILVNVRFLINEEMSLIFSNPSKHSGEIALLGEYSSESENKAYYKKSSNSGNLVPITLSLKGLMNVALRFIEHISSIDPTVYAPIIYDYKNDDYYKLSCFNGIIIGQNFDNLFQNISQTGINSCDNYTHTYDALSYILSIIIFIIFFVCRLINFYFTIKEFNNLSKFLQSFTNEDRKESSKPIYLKNKNPLPTGTVHSSHDFSIEVFAIPFIFLLITADCIFVIIFSCIKTQNFFDKFANFFEWANGAAQRSSTIMKLIIAHHIDIADDYAMKTNETKTLRQENIENIIKFQNLIDMQIIGKDNLFDKFYYSSKCEMFNDSSYDLSDFSDCLSVSNKLNLVIRMLQMLDTSLYKASFIKTNEYALIMYILDKSVINEFISFLDYLVSLSKSISNDHNSDIQMVSIIGIVILFVLCICENIFITLLYNSFDGFKELIYTIPPISVYHNKDLMDFLCNEKSQDILETTEQLVINSSQLGIISMNENFIIQSINPAFSQMFEITPQKLLGQSITYLIPLPTDENKNILFEKSQFYSAVNDMKNHFSDSDVYNIKLKIGKDDMKVIHVNANLIKIVDNFNTFKGVTIVMKDIEENIELKKQLELEKQNSDSLLKILIPRGALNSVKGKKSSVFFKAEEASLIFVEIIGMEEYISSMSPKAMIGILEKIYSGIDKVLKRYKTISMIHWENDMIFAVSGLFDTIDDFQKQAFETSAFLLEIVQVLEDINVQSSIEFHMRLGAHIGGPINGFIQNPSNPYFDVRSATFKYINFMKENGPLDVPQLTSSLVHFLDSDIFETTKISTFAHDGLSEDVFTVRFKEGYKLPENESTSSENNESEEYSKSNIEDMNDDEIKESTETECHPENQNNEDTNESYCIDSNRISENGDKNEMYSLQISANVSTDSID